MGPIGRSVEVNTFVLSVVEELLVVDWDLSGEDLSVDGVSTDLWSNESVPGLDVWWLEGKTSPPDPEGVVLAEEAPEVSEREGDLHDDDQQGGVAEVEAARVLLVTFGWSHL